MMHILKTLISKSYQGLKKIRYDQTTAKHPYYDDIYLVSFPKSGVTWLTFLIGNIELQLSGRQEFLSFYNYHLYIPDIHRTKNVNFQRKLNRTFIKSHSNYNGNYFFVIYLLRNPIDVMVSYFNYMKYYGLDLDFNQFIRHKKYGISPWVKHVDGWLYHKVLRQRIYFLKYESLIDNIENEIRSLYLNLGVDLSDEILFNAINRSNLSAMRQSEVSYQERNPNYVMSFVGKMNKIQKQELLTDYIVNYIKSEIPDHILEFYPDLKS
jgi:hypothetical protein